MKLSFSTDFWDKYSWNEYLAIAKEMQFSGIEIHDIEKGVFSEEEYLGVEKEFKEKIYIL